MITEVIHGRATEILGIEGKAVAAFLREALQHHTLVLQERPSAVRKNSPESAVTIIELTGFPPVCVKEFRWRGWLHGVKGCVRPTQGLRTYRNGCRLMAAGIPAASPLALFRYARGGLVRSEWVIMEVIPAALELDRYVLSQERQPWSCGERRAFVRSFGGFIGALHAKGILHADLKTCNILVARNQESVLKLDADVQRVGQALPHPEQDTRQLHQEDRFHFTLLDYDDVRFLNRVPWRNRVKNLVQIFLSTPLALGTTDRVRFLHAYAAACGLPGDKTRELARAVLQAARNRRILYVGFQGDITENWEITGKAWKTHKAALSSGNTHPLTNLHGTEPHQPRSRKTVAAIDLREESR